MTNTVRLTTGGQEQKFNFALPGQTPLYTATGTINSAPQPTDGIYSTYEAAVIGTSGAQAATIAIQATNRPHSAGADDPVLLQRNNIPIITTNTSTTVTSPDAAFRADMQDDEVYCVGVPTGTTFTYVSAISGTLSNAATATSPTGGAQARFQSPLWVLLGTITLTGTKRASDGFSKNASWKWVRAVVSGVTGTGATVTVSQGT
jgi:hypothetical protein